MFDALRSFWQRFQTTQKTAPTRRALFLKQRELAQDLRRLMRSYEQRLDYLQAHLLKLSDERLERDRTLFDDAHRALERLLVRLKAADHDAEGLLREWRDWLDHHDPQTLSKEAKERLEILRSELMVRGLLALDAQKPSAPSPLTVRVKQVSKRPAYQPSVLSDADLPAFDRVYKSRLVREHAWLERHWRKAVGQGANTAWKVWLTRRYKRISGHKKRLTRLIP